MMSCVVNRSGVLVSEAFGVVGELFVDSGVIPNFLLIMYSHASRRFFQEVEVPILCGSFWYNNNCFRFVSVYFCCHLP